MTTEAARRAADALNKRREAEGLKRVTVWLSKEARFRLDALKKAAGSKDKAADAAILAWAGPDAVDLVAAFADATDKILEPMIAALGAPLRMPRAPIGSRLDKKAGKVKR